MGDSNADATATPIPGAIVATRTAKAPAPSRAVAKAPAGVKPLMGILTDYFVTFFHHLMRFSGADPLLLGMKVGYRVLSPKVQALGL